MALTLPPPSDPSAADAQTHFFALRDDGGDDDGGGDVSFDVLRWSSKWFFHRWEFFRMGSDQGKAPSIKADKGP